MQCDWFSWEAYDWAVKAILATITAGLLSAAVFSIVARLKGDIR